MAHDDIVRRDVRAAAVVPLVVAWLLAAAPLLARADEHRRMLRPAAGSTTYTAECGSCHIAFPPQLLSASGWERIMTGLGRHFGTDASVDAAVVAELTGYLRANAGSPRRFGNAATRISETPWFRKEHDDVPAGAFRSKQVRSVANCAACHAQAARGDFSEDNLTWPQEARR
jgi:mono/diheme cytochrome c family protein